MGRLTDDLAKVLQSEVCVCSQPGAGGQVVINSQSPVPPTPLQTFLCRLHFVDARLFSVPLPFFFFYVRRVTSVNVPWK